MLPTARPLPAVAFVSALALAGAAALAAGDGENQTLKLHLRTDSGSERLEIDDLGDLDVGESRSYTTDSGEAVIVTRDEAGWTLDLGERKIRVGDEPALLAAPGHPRHRLRKLELDEDGTKRIVVSDDPLVHRVVVHRGGDGAEGFAFSTDGREPQLLLAGPHLLERIETSEKFLALDDATREIVREIVREAARPLAWSDGDGGDRVEIFVERRDTGDEGDAPR